MRIVYILCVLLYLIGGAMRFGELVKAVKKWVDDFIEIKGKVHYTEIAYSFNVSPTYGRLICRTLAEFYSSTYVYKDGYLMRKSKE